MDEVGRGTTVRDGLAIAFATLQHLYAVNGCRALFATHFHEVADMLGYVEPGTPAPEPSENAFEHVGFFCTDVDETEVRSFDAQLTCRRGAERRFSGRSFRVLAPFASWSQQGQSWLEGCRACRHAPLGHGDRDKRSELAKNPSRAVGRAAKRTPGTRPPAFRPFPTASDRRHKPSLSFFFMYHYPAFLLCSTTLIMELGIMYNEFTYL